MLLTTRRRWFRRSALILMTGLVTTGVGLGTLPAEAAVDRKLVTKLDAVLSDSRTTKAKSGVVVLNAGNGEELYDRYGSRAVMPASNTKVLTAVAAMHVLTPSYRFKTEVIRRAPIEDGTLTGRLYLKGYGDPTARQSDYAALAKQVRAAGITTVTGRLIVDASYFDDQRYNPGWSTGYADDYYAAPISALTVSPNADFDSGTVIINYRPGSRGAKAKITTTPAAAAKYVKLDNRTTTSARGTSTTFSASRTHGGNTITLRGQVPSGSAEREWLITVDKPELYAAAVFRAELAKVGVTVQGSTGILATPSEGRTRLAVDTSMTLGNLLVPFMKLSNNMHAEALTKAMGAKSSAPGTWSKGLAQTTAYLKGLGVPMSGVTLTDGSGLTRRNKVTPHALAATLYQVQDEPWFDTFAASLPVAGNSSRMVGGTLRRRMVGTKAADNALGKTGTLTGVTALSGYVTGADGRRYVYAMVSNYSGSTPRPVEDKLVVALAGWRRS